ncbi:hypothetical protein PIB30_034249 [Stylosanthes scabra]|uniref:Retrotransposon gag domain-containing protein n=1 Tax=Stylosanthes scabra TaxID=79078 RepID=A0ABU6VC52_9FABA|nr:hypothetical protein [Stylosanthes scabra]
MAANNEHDQGVGNQPPPSPQSQPNLDQPQSHNVPTATPNPGITTRQHSVHETEVTPGHEYNDSQQNRNSQAWARERPRNGEDRRLKKRLGKRTRVVENSTLLDLGSKGLEDIDLHPRGRFDVNPLEEKPRTKEPAIGATQDTPERGLTRHNGVMGLLWNFDKPTDMKYDSTSDPLEHTNAFEVRMNLDGVSDAIRCKAFPVTLTGQAMRVGESIRDYLDRFNKALLEVNRSSATPEVVSLCLIAGLLEGDFRRHLTSKEITSMEEIHCIAHEYMQDEDFSKVVSGKRKNPTSQPNKGGGQGSQGPSSIHTAY